MMRREKPLTEILGMIAPFYGMISRIFSQLYRILVEKCPYAEPLLEIGCGTGNLTRLLPANRISIDVSRPMLRQAMKRGVENLVLATATKLPSRRVKTVFSALVLHHLTPAEKTELLRELITVMEPGGYFCMAEFTRKHPVNIVFLPYGVLKEEHIRPLEIVDRTKWKMGIDIIIARKPGAIGPITASTPGPA